LGGEDLRVVRESVSTGEGIRRIGVRVTIAIIALWRRREAVMAGNGGVMADRGVVSSG
jgi:hypothetical protein